MPRYSRRQLHVLMDKASVDVPRAESKPASAKRIMPLPRMAPHGQGPFGGTSSTLSGIQPREPIRNKGSADTLATLAPDRDHEYRNSSPSSCFTRVIVNGNSGGGKLPMFRFVRPNAREVPQLEQCLGLFDDRGWVLKSPVSGERRPNLRIGNALNIELAVVEHPAQGFSVPHVNLSTRCPR